MEFDLHTHTTYSDGSLMYIMIDAAQKQGLKEIGLADHCNVSKRENMVETKYQNGFNLDQTYQRRRKAIKGLRQKYDIKIHDAVEMDYDPRDEEEIKNFLNEAGFDYSLGSVHRVDNTHVQVTSHFQDKTRKTRRRLVQEYFDKLQKMIESEIFDIASHIDVFERNPQFQDLATTENYETIAEAFKNSRTIPEINAGHALKGLKELHPTTEFRKILLEKEIEFTTGTDSHNPQAVQELNQHLKQKLEEHNIDPVRPQTLQSRK